MTNARAARLLRIMDRLRLRELAVLVAILLITLGTWGFIELANEVTEGETREFDRWVLRALREAENPCATVGPEWLEEVGRDITALGSWSVLTLAILAATGYLLLQRKFHAMWLVLGATITGQIASSLLKNVFARERPDVVPHLTIVSTESFPSGHAMMSAVVYLTLGALFMRLVAEVRAKVYLMTVALFLTFIVGLSRVYLGVHYPTDVLAGWSAGMVWALLCWLAARYLQRRGAVEQES